MPGKISAAPANSNPNKNSQYTEGDTDDTENETEGEDSQEEEVETEESSDEESDTSEDESSDDESEEDSDTEEEGEEETEGQEKKPYIDVKSLPPQLREIGKRMLDSHTKAMAKIPKLVEEKMEELQNAYSEVLVKASGFDKVVKIPGFDKFFEDAQNGRGYGYSSDFRTSAKPKQEDDSSDSSDEKVTTESLMKQLTPVIRKLITDEVGPIKKDSSKALWEDAEKNLPNFKLYKAKVTQIMLKHPSLSIPEAYSLATEGKEAVKKVVKESKEVKKLPRTLKPGGSGNRPLSEATVNSIDDALRLASRDHLNKRGG